MLGRQLMFVKDINRSDLRATLGNGAEVLFRSMDDPERARGPNLSGSWLDECSLMERSAYEIVIACLREGGEAGWLSATFTPKGKGHWTFDVFGTGKPDTALYRSRTKDNPFLPDSFYGAVKSQYAGAFALQELEGEFIDAEGNIARREWFPISNAQINPNAPRVRYWDMAATERSAKSDDPDYTVGTLMAVEAGKYYIEHVIRGRWGPGDVERIIKQTAEMDGRKTVIRWEQEGGASGKIVSGAMLQLLAGWDARPEIISGDKIQRAQPFLAQAEGGNVRIMPGEWTTDWLDEMVSVPMGSHDDQWDSAAGAFRCLTASISSVSIMEY